jgi:hypothetical protein
MGETQEKIAFHRLRMEDGTLIEGPLVVVYEDGLMVRYYPLVSEEAEVIWQGGVGTPRR